MGKENIKPEFERLEDRTLFSTAYISTNPPAVVTPGVDYTMYVVGDNRELNPEETVSSQWNIYNPCYEGTYDYILGASIIEARLPTSNDFFEGKNMALNDVKLPGTIPSARDVQIGESGVVNKIGNLGEYVFNVNGYTGNYGARGYFYMNNQYFGGTDGNNPSQPLVVSNNLFTIAKTADTNLDNDVDIFDFLSLQGNYGTTSGATWQQGDFNNDSDVDIFDFLSLQSEYGWTAGGGSSIPEPSTLGVIALGGIGLGVLRRRNRKVERGELEGRVE